MSTANLGDAVTATWPQKSPELAEDRFALFVKQQNKVLSLILHGEALDRILFKAIEKLFHR